MAGRPGRASVSAVAALAFACAAGGRAGSAPARGSAASPLELKLTTPKDAFVPGEAIPARLVLTNTSSGPVTLRFTSGQRYDFSVHDASGRQLWRWSDGRAFTMVLGSETLPPGGALNYDERLDPALEAGPHTIRGTITAEESALSASAPISVRPRSRPPGRTP